MSYWVLRIKKFIPRQQLKKPFKWYLTWPSGDKITFWQRKPGNNFLFLEGQSGHHLKVFLICYMKMCFSILKTQLLKSTDLTKFILLTWKIVDKNSLYSKTIINGTYKLPILNIIKIHWLVFVYLTFRTRITRTKVEKILVSTFLGHI